MKCVNSMHFLFCVHVSPHYLCTCMWGIKINDRLQNSLIYLWLSRRGSTAKGYNCVRKAWMSWILVISVRYIACYGMQVVYNIYTYDIGMELKFEAGNVR